MEHDDLLAEILTRSAKLNKFEDWADILAEYASSLWEVRDKLEPQEIERLLNVGAAFYRTLARAEDYRRSPL